MLLFMDMPRTLLEAVTYFSDADNCLNYMVSRRWPDGVVRCPTCNAAHVRFDKKRRVFECNKKHPKRQFSVKVGTIFEDSPLGLDKWLPTVWMIANAKNGVSSHEIARSIGVTQKTAWFMLHRIRLAMQGPSGGTLDGEVEVDETYIGGRARFMHKDKRAAKITGTGGAGKAAVMGLLERHGKDGHSRVKTKVVANVKRKTLSPEVRANVEQGSAVFSDALKSYADLGSDYEHQVIDHAESYAKGRIHTNGLENFWSLLKRSIKGTYVNVEPFHLFRYLDEQSFRFNLRKGTDALRFLHAAAGLIGRRVQYKELIGQTTTA